MNKQPLHLVLNGHINWISRPNLWPLTRLIFRLTTKYYSMFLTAHDLSNAGGGGGGIQLPNLTDAPSDY